MDNEAQGIFLSKSQKFILAIFFIALISFLLIFKNIFFQSSVQLRNLGNQSFDPKIALVNNKPTFLEFYAEWCEVCKQMAPNISEIKKEFDNNINFVFLNVDNPKWQNYIQQFDVNGIPQINLLNKKNNLEATFVGLQTEELIQKSLNELLNNEDNIEDSFSEDISLIKKRKINNISPRSHG